MNWIKYFQTDKKLSVVAPSDIKPEKEKENKEHKEQKAAKKMLKLLQDINNSPSN